MGRRVCALLVALFATGCAARGPGGVHPSRPLGIAVVPSLGLAPRDLHITVRIDRDRDARAWCVTLWQGEIDERRSCATHDGARFQQFPFLGVGEGDYLVQLQVEFGDGHVEQAQSHPICLAGPTHSCSLTP